MCKMIMWAVIINLVGFVHRKKVNRFKKRKNKRPPD